MHFPNCFLKIYPSKNIFSKLLFQKMHPQKNIFKIAFSKVINLIALIYSPLFLSDLSQEEKSLELS